MLTVEVEKATIKIDCDLADMWLLWSCIEDKINFIEEEHDVDKPTPEDYFFSYLKLTEWREKFIEIDRQMKEGNANKSQ